MTTSKKRPIPAAVLFDLDGVLIDTEPVYTRIWQDIDDIYPTGVENFATVIKGNTLPRILEQYYPDTDIRASVIKLLAEREEQMEYPLFAGVPELLDELEQARIPAAIVTSSGRKKMRRLADSQPHFISHFAAIVTDSDVRYSKPHPDPYLCGARALGADASACLVFEDSLAGMQSGTAAGATVIGIATTLPRHRVAGHAHAVIDGFDGMSFYDILDLL